MIIVDHSYCTSLAQLKGYFSMSLDANSDVYYDLLDYGRNQDISKWLRENGEDELANNLDAIDDNLTDSEFFAKMSRIILGEEVQTPAKPDFSLCLTIQKVQYAETDTGMNVSVYLRILETVNENYELKIETEWGTHIEIINTFNSKKGSVLKYERVLRKRPFKNLENISLYADNKLLLHLSVKELNDRRVEKDTKHGLSKMDSVIEQIGKRLDQDVPPLKSSLNNCDTLEGQRTDSIGGSSYNDELPFYATEPYTG